LLPAADRIQITVLVVLIVRKSWTRLARRYVRPILPIRKPVLFLGDRVPRAMSRAPWSQRGTFRVGVFDIWQRSGWIGEVPRARDEFNASELNALGKSFD